MWIRQYRGETGWWSALALLSAFSAAVSAAEPTVRNVNIRGLQVGGATTVVFDGEDLGAAPRLILPFPFQAELKPGSTPKQATFTVSLDGSITPGYYNARLATEGGLSSATVIGVDRLPQRAFAPLVDSLPVALHGAVGGSATLETKFQGVAGQKLLVEVEARRLGSKLRPVLHLYSAKRRQVAWSWPTESLLGDTRLETTLPEAGEYVIALHDVEFGPPGPSHFRLRIGDWAYVDRVFPPQIAKGRPNAVELLGSESLRVDLPADVPTATALAWPKDGVWSGPRPFITAGAPNELLEQPPADPPQELPPGVVVVSGRLLTPYEEDRFRLPVSPLAKIKMEVFAERHGSPLDTAVIVRNDKGDQLARGEDGPGTLDPVLEFTVPEKVTSLVVGIVDGQGRGGPRGTYRFVITPAVTDLGPSEFSLATSAAQIPLPLGGRFVAPVFIERRGARLPIEVSAAGFPAGVRLEGTQIPADMDGVLVTVLRGDDAAEPAVTQWSGKTPSGETRAIYQRGHPLLDFQPWLAAEIAVAPLAAKAADFVLDWRDVPTDAALVPAGKLSLAVKLSRTADAAPLPVRLSLVTSQNPPFTNNQPDLNKTLRLEKPVELAANAADGEIAILIPAELPYMDYDVCVQAELLSADKKTVQALAFTPVKRLPMRSQLLVTVNNPRVELTPDAKTGGTAKVEGKIERREGLTGDVLLTVAGLPNGYRADNVTVKADAADFVLNVVVPPTAVAGEVKGLKLSASGVADAKQPNIRVKSRDTELVLVIQSPPPAATP